MTQPDRHRIRRQVIDLRVASSLVGVAAQETLARNCWQRAIPELCKVFDAVAGSRQLVRLDRLEIDLGTLEGLDWEPQFRDRLVAELKRRLAGYAAADGGAAPRALNPSADLEPVEQFEYFLVHGRLPWWGVRPTASWSVVLQAARTTFPRASLRACLLDCPQARVRFVDALDDELLEGAFAGWAGLPGAAQVLARLTPTRLAPASRRRWRREFWTRVLDWVLADGFAAGRGTELMRELRALRVSHSAPHADAAVTRVAAHGALPMEPEEDITLPQPWLAWHIESRPAAVTPALDGGAEQQVRRRPARPTYRTELRATRTVERTRAAADQADAIYLPCAGVVLLHPFLEPLFRDRGLLEERRFRDGVARQRAVHLLGYLGCGVAEVPEYDLVIAKLLCGEPLDAALEPVALDAQDLSACDALLAAVLGHWSALRSSSAQWLRTQFFLRDGKLEPVDEGHRLTIERRAQDVLLARIPWGFGVIGLPWMQQRLFVRWLD